MVLQYSGDEVKLPNESIDPKGRIKLYKNGDYIVLDTNPACGLRVAFSGDGLDTVALVVVHPDYSNEGAGVYSLRGLF